jgi:zinc transport system substrate-binding protein
MLKSITRSALSRSALAVGVLLSLPLACAMAAEADGPTYRALVADHANGKLTALDVVSGKTIGHYGVEGPARLKLDDQGRHVFATQGKQGIINIVDLGLKIEGHGDHLDIDTFPLKLLPTAVSGPSPSHVNMGAGKIAFFFDGDGTAHSFSSATLLQGKGKPVITKTAAPHHGVAKPMGDLTAISIPHATDPKALPIGIDLVRANGTSVSRSADCPRMHGEGATADVVAFGCADGVLALRTTKGVVSFEKWPYPATLPAEKMVRNMSGGKGVRVLIGDFGPDGMVTIDPAAKRYSFIQLPSRRMAFALEQSGGDAAFVITEDGSVHRINTLLATIEKSAPATEKYSMDGGSAVPRPRLAAHGDMLLVTDPAKSRVLVLDTKTLQLRREIAVPGAPFDIVLTGGVAMKH